MAAPIVAAPGIEPHLFVIFGATGDLTRRKLLPSLHRVITENGVGDDLYLLAVSRTDIDDGTFRDWAAEALVEHGIADTERARKWCFEHIYYEPSPADVHDLDNVRTRIEKIEAIHGLPGNRVFYLALPPVAFPDTIAQLGDAGLNRSAAGWTRLVVEKPFGTDLESAQSLNRLVHTHFDESQVYRIDHYLGKETVQNVLAFRFSNLLFETAWNRDRVEKVEITVAESLGIERRAGYYEKAGVIRDMVQNHLSQLFTLVAMEPPHAFTADSIRSEKIQVLESVAPINPNDVVLGQYGAGEIDKSPVVGYLGEENVASDSSTPTFVALKLAINNWRWEGVPFYLRTGKRLPVKTTQIVVTFRRPPVCLFHGVQDSCAMHQNVLILTLQPDEGFELHFDVKAPAEQLQLKSQRLHFDYAEAFNAIPDAYQTLILDVIQGDQTLFVHADEVEKSWTLFTPLLSQDLPVVPYEAGSWGPAAVETQLDRNTKPWVMRRT